MANEYLKRITTSTGNRSVFTWSGWVKRNSLTDGAPQSLFTGGVNGSDRGVFDFNDVDTLRFGFNNSGSWSITETTAKFRDPGSWMNVILSVNLTTSGNEDVSIYVNGIKISSSAVTWPSIVNNVWNAAGYGMYIAIPYEQTSQMYEGEMFDVFWVDGQALTPDVFGFYKDGNGYISAGSTQATDFRPGQWVPKSPSVIKNVINNSGGFGVNGFYLPMNDSSNPGADFHCAPNSIIKLKGEDLPQPRNGAPTTSDAYVSQLRSDPYAANLVLAVPGISGGTSSGYGDYSADIKGSGTNKTLTATGNASVAADLGGYYGSAMTFDNDGTDGSGTTDVINIPTSSDFVFTGDMTMECWIYPTETPTNGAAIVGQWLSSGGTNRNLELVFDTSNRVIAYFNSSATNYDTETSPALALNQWYHIATEKDGSNFILYLNGVCVGINTNIPTAGNTSTVPFTIGSESDGSDGASFGFNGQIQDVRVYKGVAKYKGGFDVPKPYTPVGIESWRAVSDTCSNNFATWNPIYPGFSSNATFSNGNLTIADPTSNTSQGTGTFGPSSGKWYYEARAESVTGSSHMIGIRAAEWNNANSQNSLNYRSGGQVYNYSSAATSQATYTTGDVIGIAFDPTNGRLWFSKNGVWTDGDPSTGSGQNVNYTPSATTAFFAFDNVAGTQTWDTNFGQNPSFSGTTTAGTNADDSGKGLFKYAPPTGFLALCEDNLPTPAIKNPGEHFKTLLYHGDSNDGHSITGVGFQPDLVWIKERTSTSGHFLLDSVRGATNFLSSHDADEESSSDNTIKSFDSDGFSLGASGAFNVDDDYVAWCWKAGGAAVSNTDGTITSQVSANQDAGFSIVSWTSDGTNLTVGHGLNKVPSLIIQKQRDASANWTVYHEDLAATEILELNSTTAKQTSSDFGNTLPTSSVLSSFTTGVSGRRIIAYCWTEIEGFSKFGSYVGNGNADGPFVYCGFKPAWVVVKRTTTGGSEGWSIFDSSRGPTNPNPKGIYANSNIAENDASGRYKDFVSNGFKVRGTSGEQNTSGVTYIFAAFAESPFQTANAK